MEYKRFGETRSATIIIDTHVLMSWTSNNKNKYIELGYKFTKMREKFLIKINHLSANSHMLVTTKCPICKTEKQTKYQDINTVGHTLCKGCANIKEMKGIKFGRLTMIDMDFEKSGDRVIWWKCVCDCGKEFSVRRSNLISTNPTMSCGCYHVDQMKAQCGENHYNWNPDLSDEERSAGRRSKEDKRWRADVYERDGYTCQVCGDKTGGNFEAHHLYSYKHYPEHRLNVDYGVTICKDEHIEFHRWMGTTSDPCTPEHFKEWKSTRIEK